MADTECFRSGMFAPRHVEVHVRALVLNDLVRFSNFIQPVCLLSLHSDKAATLVITGWGNIEGGFSGHVTAMVLQQLVMKEVPLQKCGEICNAQILPNRICASTGSPGQTPCQGDSGGPLVRLVDRRKEIW